MKRLHSLVAVTALVAIGVVVPITLYRSLAPDPSKSHAAVPSEHASAGHSFPRPHSSAEQVRPELFEALESGVESPWQHRLDLIRSLPSDLTAIEVNALLTAMMEPCPAAWSPAIHSTYLHEIACILQPRQDIRERFTNVLTTLARDSRRDQSTRDYAIQHLRQVWVHASDDPALRTAIVATFREFISLDPVVSTPALLSLHLLSLPSENGTVVSSQTAPDQSASTDDRPANPHFSPQIPDSELITLLQQGFAAKTSISNMPTRLTAIRIAGERRMTAYRAQLLGVLKDPSEHALVRMAAANAIGTIAEPVDLELLSTFDPKDARVATALRHALQTRTEH